jgi:hypothetical protein
LPGFDPGASVSDYRDSRVRILVVAHFRSLPERRIQKPPVPDRVNVGYRCPVRVSAGAFDLPATGSRQQREQA